MRIYVKCIEFIDGDNREIHATLTNDAVIKIRANTEFSFTQTGGNTEEKGASVELAFLFFPWLSKLTDDPTMVCLKDISDIWTENP